MGMVEPGLMIVAGARLILPEGKPPRRAWPELAFAMLMEPAPDELTVWLSRLEQTLGVTDAMRTAMAGRAVSAAETSEQKRRRLLEQSQRAAKLNAPMRNPSLARLMRVKRRAAAAHMAHAERLRAAAPGKLERKLIRRLEAKARDLLEGAEEARITELDQDRLYGEAKETILLAQARGEEVLAYEAETAEIARDEHGAVIRHKRGSKRGLPVLVYDTGLRAKKLTGIEHAIASGYLQGARGPGQVERLRATADQYGEAYEIDEGQRSGKAGFGEGGGGGFGPKGVQLKAVEAGETLAIMRAGMSPRERRVLDLVCGEQMRAREAATVMGAGFPATVRALRGGLKLAGENWRAAVERRKQSGEPGAAQRAAAAHEVISRVRAG